MQQTINTLFQLVRDYWFILSLLLAITISFLSLTPLTELPSVAGNDKTHHFIAYSALALPLMLRKPRFWFVGLVLFILLSGAIELIQPFVNRYGEWLDLLANLGGICCGAVLAYIINRCFPAS